MTKCKNQMNTGLYLNVLVLCLLVMSGCATSNIWRMSVDKNANEANKDSYDAVVVTAHVAFVSFATNLAPGATNGLRQILVRETTTNVVQMVSKNSNGDQGNAYSHLPSISHDGQYVAFQSKASNLVSGDMNAQDDIFVHNRNTGKTELVSVDSNGKQSIGASTWPSISADGRYVAFESSNPLVSGDTNNHGDVYVRDRQMGKTERVSVDSSGKQANNDSGDPSISSDGRYIAFYSKATNLIPNDTNGSWDVFVYDRQSGKTELVSVNSNGGQGNGWSLFSSISGNGRYVAFISSATNLVAGDTNGKVDVFVHDRQTGKTERVSVNSNGGQTNGDSGDLNSWRCVSISEDGNFIVFESEASNLVGGDTNNREDVFLHDRATKKTVRLSVNNDGVQGNNHSGRPSITPDGRYVVFQSKADNLLTGDTNSATDVFMTPNPLAKW